MIAYAAKNPLQKLSLSFYQANNKLLSSSSFSKFVLPSSSVSGDTQTVMFYIYDTSKVGAPYTPGSLDEVRGARARAASAVEKVEGSTTTGNSRQAVDPDAEGQQRGTGHYEAVLQKRREKVVMVSQVMTEKPVTVAPGDSIDMVWALFRSRRFRHVPVVNKGTVVGLVSDRDILPRVGAAGETVQESSLTVLDVMSTPVLAVRPDSPIRKAARAMVEEHVGALPVVAADHGLVGIITRSDILRAVVWHAPLELWI